MTKQQVTAAPTMYDLSFEKDACGMGFIAQMEGTASHQLVKHALTMLERMNHRGGTGAEPETGDGAGILATIPDKFFQREAKAAGVSLPDRGQYAVGMFFLPAEEEHKNGLQQALVKEIEAAGYLVLWQRDVPFQYENCGPGAQKVMPSFVQLFIKRPLEVQTDRDFEDRLYRLRRKLEKTYHAGEMAICSLSSKTIVYKGMLHAYQVGIFYDDLQDEDFAASIAVVHSRFSTNTFPSWDRAQPFRFLAHNGEINTLRGSENWMKSHGIEVYNEEDSDSAKLENCMEYLYRNGRDIPHALMMMVPEAWSEEAGLGEEMTAFQEYNASFMAPWDGPAALCFTDGEMVGATLDRNGLRPSRYSITKDGFVQVASESGVVDFAPSNVIEKGVLGPANMILVDTINGKFYRNQEIKEKYAKAHTYKEWLAENRIELSQLAETEVQEAAVTGKELQRMWKLNGYTDEIIRGALLQMAEKGEEPVLSMGYDSPLAVLSDKPQSLFTYFKQQFAQVTNPPIDAIREQLVIGTEMFLGRDGDIRVDDAHNCQKLKIKSPVLSSADFLKIAQLNTKEQKAVTISTLYPIGNRNALEDGLEQMFKEAESAIDKGATILILSDRGAVQEKMAMPILLAVSGLHNHLVRKGKASLASLVVDSAEVCEVHHFATLIGYGASGIHPYGAYATLNDFDIENGLENYRKAAEKGIVKVMSRMGISTIAGYHGAQLFEVVGISQPVTDKYFTGTASRIGGLSLYQIEEEYLQRHSLAYGPQQNDLLASGGSFQYKADGEHHYSIRRQFIISNKPFEQGIINCSNIMLNK